MASVAPSWLSWPSVAVVAADRQQRADVIGRPAATSTQPNSSAAQSTPAPVPPLGPGGAGAAVIVGTRRADEREHAHEREHREPVSLFHEAPSPPSIDGRDGWYHIRPAEANHPGRTGHDSDTEPARLCGMLSPPAQARLSRLRSRSGCARGTRRRAPPPLGDPPASIRAIRALPTTTPSANAGRLAPARACAIPTPTSSGVSVSGRSGSTTSRGGPGELVARRPSPRTWPRSTRSRATRVRDRPRSRSWRGAGRREEHRLDAVRRATARSTPPPRRPGRSGTIDAGDAGLARLAEERRRTRGGRRGSRTSSPRPARPAPPWRSSRGCRRDGRRPRAQPRTPPGSRRRPSPDPRTGCPPRSRRRPRRGTLAAARRRHRGARRSRTGRSSGRRRRGARGARPRDQASRRLERGADGLEVLVAATREAHEDDRALRQRPVQQPSDHVRRLERRQDALGARERLEARERVGRPWPLTYSASPASCRYACSGPTPG